MNDTGKPLHPDAKNGVQQAQNLNTNIITIPNHNSRSHQRNIRSTRTRIIRGGASSQRWGLHRLRLPPSVAPVSWSHPHEVSIRAEPRTAMRPPPLPSALLFPSLLLAVIAQMRNFACLLLGTSQVSSSRGVVLGATPAPGSGPLIQRTTPDPPYGGRSQS